MDDQTKKLKNIKMEKAEDVTKYGEFISSFHDWISFENQQKKVDKLENITKGNKGSS